MPIVNIDLANYPISSINIDGTGWMLNESAKWTANTGKGAVKTANTGLDGGGALTDILTAASNGTFIKTVTIKSIVVNGSGGMVRLFLYDGTNTRLLQEVEVPPTGGGAGSTFQTFHHIVQLNFNLKATWHLKASTEAAKEFEIFAEGLDWTY